ncbi:MAG: hypothetical protein ACE5LX_01775 [Nitrospinota bacterium]
MPIKRGDVIRHIQAGAGGYGDPLERDPELVLRDVRNGKVSIARAREDYGVVIEPEPLRLNLERTARLRQRLHRLPREEPPGE